MLMLLLLGAVACLASFLVTQQLRSTSERALSAPQTSVPSLDSKQQLQTAKNERFVYPYSVIPGGVQSREELTSVIGSDPIVAEHYARFAVSQAKIVHATETQFVHVAYRLRNKVYWTAKKVKIPKGETLISDGTDTARTRCGNRVSAVPLEPVSEEEPAVEIFDSAQSWLEVEAPELEVPPSGLEFSAVPTLATLYPSPASNNTSVLLSSALRRAPGRRRSHNALQRCCRPRTRYPEPAVYWRGRISRNQICTQEIGSLTSSSLPHPPTASMRFVIATRKAGEIYTFLIPDS